MMKIIKLLKKNIIIISLFISLIIGIFAVPSAYNSIHTPNENPIAQIEEITISGNLEDVRKYQN